VTLFLEGVGGHITLCISRAGVEVIALVLLLVAVGIWETQFPLSWLELIHFQHIKAFSSCINEGEQLGRFFGVAGEWILSIGKPSLLVSAHRCCN